LRSCSTSAPDVAVFGRRISSRPLSFGAWCELNFPIEIVVAPTVREGDGLALESELLSRRRVAAGGLALVESLRAAATAFGGGERAAHDS
jgi:pantoate--beta-alanine ligase